MSKHYPVEQRERAVKMVLDHLDEYRSVYAPIKHIRSRTSHAHQHAHMPHTGLAHDARHTERSRI